MARYVVLLADESKFSGGGFATVCGADALDVVITNDGAAPGTVDTLREAGVEVICT